MFVHFNRPPCDDNFLCIKHSLLHDLEVGRRRGYQELAIRRKWQAAVVGKCRWRSLHLPSQPSFKVSVQFPKPKTCNKNHLRWVQFHILFCNFSIPEVAPFTIVLKFSLKDFKVPPQTSIHHQRYCHPDNPPPPLSLSLLYVYVCTCSWLNYKIVLTTLV